MTIDKSGRRHQPAGAPASTGGQFAAGRSSAHTGTLTAEPASIAVLDHAGAAPGSLRLRTDGRFEVADNGDANEAFGCQDGDECILAHGHAGECSEDRESWAGDDELYPAAERSISDSTLIAFEQATLAHTDADGSHPVRDIQAMLQRGQISEHDVHSITASAVLADRVGAAFNRPVTAETAYEVADDVIAESYDGYAEDGVEKSGLALRLERRAVDVNYMQQLANRAIQVDRAKRQGLEPPVVDYRGKLDEARRAANTRAGGSYWTPAELAEIERPVHICTSCGTGVSKYAIFPEGRCASCHAASLAGDPQHGADDIAKMWGASQIGR